MIGKYKLRRNIERATAFKVVCAIIGSDEGNQEREFQNLKSMRQWIDRNGELFGLLVLNTLTLIDGEWEPFTTIGKKTITLSDLESIVRNLREDYKPSEIEK